MSEVTRILESLSGQEDASVERLFPLVYDELRQIAKHKLAAERSGNTLHPTDLVHEAFLRLISSSNTSAWNNRKYFFAAAAEAMRRILVDSARRKSTQKRGANSVPEWTDLVQFPAPGQIDELLNVHESLDNLAVADPQAAELVKLRYFAGFSMQEISEILGISLRQAQYTWAFARAWLFRALKSDDSTASYPSPPSS
jgi:RNA polymerase sigma factor (TIGR02999 family)